MRDSDGETNDATSGYVRAGIKYRLRDLVAGARSAGLPPMRALAGQWGVSRPTVARAARDLAREGLITIHRRRGMRIQALEVARDEVPAAGAGHTTFAYERLADELRSAMREGGLRDGDPLPKVSYLAGSRHLADRTVTAAYRSLAREGLAHRRGRSWIAGRQPSSVAQGRGTSPEVILLVMPTEQTWTGLQTERTGAFCRMFVEEVRRRAVMLMPVVSREGVLPEGILTAGRIECSRLIARLGERYRGALIVGRRARMPDLRHWVVELCAWKRPVVWFDELDDPLEKPVDSRLFSRCHFSEQAALVTALKTLWDRGHRRVGYADVFGMRDWRGRRGRRLAELAGKHFDGLRADLPRAGPDFWDALSGESLDEQIACLRRHGVRVVRESLGALEAHLPDLPGFLRSYLSARGRLKLSQLTGGTGNYNHAALLRNSPLMIHLLRERRATAIVAPCDLDAREVYFWLRAAGVAVPREVSLISFDNCANLHPLPVSTIDFGFGDLGYRAFHLVMDDIPVRRDRGGNVAARPFVMEQGSVAAPRQKRIQADLSGNARAGA